MIKNLSPEHANALRIKLFTYHKNPTEIPGMALEVWEDGELTSTKCSNGTLYGQRNLHCLERGSEDSLPEEIFPEQNTYHAFVRCASMDDAMACRTLVLDHINLTETT